MAVLASKGTASVTLAIGETLNVLAGGQGVAVLKGGASKGQSVELGASVRKIGPFPFAMPITINSQSGALTYYVGADSAAPHVEIAGEYDAASGQTVLDDASRAVVARSVGMLVDLSKAAIIGDSFTNRMWRSQVPASITGDGTTATANATSHGLPTGSRIRVVLGSGATGLRTPESQITVVDGNTFTYPSTGVGTLTSPSLYGFTQPSDYGWATWFRAITGITWAYNYGFGGATSVDLSAHIPALQSASPSIVFAQYGINDANTLNGASDDTAINAIVSQVVATDDALVAACAAVGAVLVLSTVPPEAAGYINFGTPRTKALLRINASRRARRSFTVRIADEWAAWVDGLSTTGVVTSTWIASDNLHPSSAGALRLANVKYQACSDLLPPDPRPRVASYTETSTFDASCKQALPNPTFTGAGPTADLWTTAGANWTPSLVARADGKGNNQRLTAASATVNGTLTSNTFHTKLAAGNRIKIGCEITCSGITSMGGFQIGLTMTQNGIVTTTYAVRNALTPAENGSIPALASGNTYYFESEELELQYAPTNAQFVVTGVINGTSSVTIDVGTPRVDILN